jgi:hypothetical protein
MCAAFTVLMTSILIVMIMEPDLFTHISRLAVLGSLGPGVGRSLDPSPDVSLGIIFRGIGQVHVPGVDSAFRND